MALTTFSRAYAETVTGTRSLSIIYGFSRLATLTVTGIVAKYITTTLSRSAAITVTRIVSHVVTYAFTRAYNDTATGSRVRQVQIPRLYNDSVTGRAVKIVTKRVLLLNTPLGIVSHTITHVYARLVSNTVTSLVNKTVTLLRLYQDTTTGSRVKEKIVYFVRSASVSVVAAVSKAIWRLLDITITTIAPTVEIYPLDDNDDN